MAHEVIIDFETASAMDLKKSGAWKYSECPTTEILCVSYCVDGGKIITLGAEQLSGSASEELRALARDINVTFIAHNAGFEKAIWRHIMVPDYRYDDIPNICWEDTAAVCAMKALPLGLDWAAKVSRISYTKDTEGSRLTVSLSKTNKKGYYDRSPETLKRVYKYCESDIRAQHALWEKNGRLQASEREVWLLDQEINERGVRIDVPYVKACQSIIEGASVPLIEEFTRITGGLKPTQRDKVKKWVNDSGVPIENLQKGTIEDLLGIGYDNDTEIELEEKRQASAMLNMPENVCRALKIRHTVGSASIKKLPAIRLQTMSDGRVRGLLQYHGAGPGRWTGRLFQPHNFPRGTVKIGKEPADPAIVHSAISTRDHEFVEAILGEPINAVVGGLRHCIIPAEGHLLAVGDYSSIEARTVLALAGQHDKCSLLASGEDVYIAMAEEIYQRKIIKGRDVEERQVGKSTVLGCGFQMGWKTFQEKYASNHDAEFAKRCIAAYREDFAPLVPELWAGLQEASTRAVWDHKTMSSHGVTYSHEDMWLVARLPSGRKIYYPNPIPSKKAMPWDKEDIRPTWQCQAWKLGRWITRDMYGGLLTQNVVEALARDVMVYGMRNCEANGYPIILTVHDEIICEPLTTDADPDTLRDLMLDIPEWAKTMGISVDAECWIGDRYKK
jgi:DNA polymerase